MNAQRAAQALPIQEDGFVAWATQRLAAWAGVA
jgi:hypothetical protein